VLNLWVLLPESSIRNKMVFVGMVCDGDKWSELATDHVQWCALVLAVLDHSGQLPEY
jgi:hypothetical protein